MDGRIVPTFIQWMPYKRHIHLSDLDSLEFAASAFPMTDNSLVILRHLETNPIIIELRRRLEDGSLSESQCRDFTQRLLKDFRSKYALHPHALMGLCAVFRGLNHPFAKEFLLELSELSNTMEFASAGRVAKVALENESLQENGASS